MKERMEALCPGQRGHSARPLAVRAWGALGRGHRAGNEQVRRRDCTGPWVRAVEKLARGVWSGGVLRGSVETRGARAGEEIWTRSPGCGLDCSVAAWGWGTDRPEQRKFESRAVAGASGEMEMH